MVLIALGYNSRVGKDTAADHLVEKFGYEKYSFATKLREITNTITPQKNGDLMQDVADVVKKHMGYNYFVSYLHDQIGLCDPSDNIVVTDVRYKNEYIMLQSLGFIFVRVTREDRPIDRNQNHDSEHQLAHSWFDHNIDNNGDIEALKQKIEEIVLHEYELFRSS
jgi:hypothetical protein